MSEKARAIVLFLVLPGLGSLALGLLAIAAANWSTKDEQCAQRCLPMESKLKRGRCFCREPLGGTAVWVDREGAP